MERCDSGTAVRVVDGMNGMNNAFLRDIARGRYAGGGVGGIGSREVGTESLEFILDHTNGLRRVGLNECKRGSARKLDQYVRALMVRCLDNAWTFAPALRRGFMIVFPKRDMLRDSCKTLVGGPQLPLL